jgi:hypothetical protein
MTIKELVQKLQNYPEDTRVLVEGYEGGFDHVDRVREGVFVADISSKWYYGDHGEVKEHSNNTFSGIVLMSREKN